MSILLQTEKADEGKRLDIFISDKLNISRAKAQEAIEKKFVKVNNYVKTKSYKIKFNDLIEVSDEFSLKLENSEKLIPQNIPIQVIYKDDYLIVLSKPAGMVVYPCAGHPDGTLMNALAYHVKKLANVGAPFRPGIVHRLDKDTSGVMVVALDDETYYKLVEAFKKREIKKEYLALVYGQLRGSGKITTPVGRAIYDRKKMSIKSKKAKEAITEWEVIKNFKNYTFLKVKILTGRTHQIRVHFSSIGHPVIGDKTYGRKTYIEIGNKKIPVSRQMLHAHKIELIHPITEKLLQFEASLPDDIQYILNILEDRYESE
ncbi:MULTISPECIES: RluA family pseudouridine synthase [Thermodesulfovibrio]|jgi:23S rRNA pseudouridine1911/1915/1917 synthase|uniref:Pseudouridine synthase n=1 Tax=Thermodesulfovibrio yellowstonii (strain ATCC 51303 / DSM 11347 / YP87) TaxID=289376 RepID=B5YKV0_THEYD|nr:MULTISPECIES: RluA family pseudouridine synthase [Thermodesulfovibrio]ACI20648.1 pseudouridylate synthase, 23S RNA-specific [Thermodesulfovibrio yellowstonii DSM 11347]